MKAILIFCLLCSMIKVHKASASSPSTDTKPNCCETSRLVEMIRKEIPVHLRSRMAAKVKHLEQKLQSEIAKELEEKFAKKFQLELQEMLDKVKGLTEKVQNDSKKKVIQTSSDMQMKLLELMEQLQQEIVFGDAKTQKLSTKMDTELQEKIQDDDVSNLDACFDKINEVRKETQAGDDRLRKFSLRMNRELLRKIAKVNKDIDRQRPRKDCLEHYERGHVEDGLYLLASTMGVRQHYCVQSQYGGGWTVIQRRVDGSVDFYRNWDEYKKGFGSPEGNYWMGLESMHRMTTETTLRLDMFTLGSGEGGTQVEIAKQDTEVACLQACYKLRAAGDATINGCDFGVGKQADKNKRCYCNKGMSEIKTDEDWSKDWRTSYIVLAGASEVMFRLQDFQGNKKYARYNHFQVEDEASSYQLRISGFSGTADDAMHYHNNRKFTTKDRDNDLRDYNCAKKHLGAWWYKGCVHSNLNGVYGSSVSSTGIYWDEMGKLQSALVLVRRKEH